MILVKATPVLTSEFEETMCVAGISLDDNPRWIRLYPVPFRDLADESKFRKYQEISVSAFRNQSDRRPESWAPIDGSIKIGDTLGTDHNWSTRRQRVATLGEATMCDLVALNRKGSGPQTPSLAVIRTAGPPTFRVTERDSEQLAEWRQRAEVAGSRKSLFDDPNNPKPDFEVIPWRFSYHYRCLATECRGHKQTIVDWEAVALYRKVQRSHDWKERMRKKFEDELWAPSRDTVLFVGNQEQHPHAFLVLGVFWPPRSSVQGALFS